MVSAYFLEPFFLYKFYLSCCKEPAICAVIFNNFSLDYFACLHSCTPATICFQGSLAQIKYRCFFHLHSLSLLSLSLSLSLSLIFSFFLSFSLLSLSLSYFLFSLSLSLILSRSFTLTFAIFFKPSIRPFFELLSFSIYTCMYVLLFLDFYISLSIC